MSKQYHQPGYEGVTSAVDKLQQEFHCCGSNNWQDWQDSEWVRSGQAKGHVVPDSCCKTVVAGCGERDHASNIYKVEVGWLGCGCGGSGLEGPPPSASHMHPAREAASPSWRPSSRST